MAASNPLVIPGGGGNSLGGSAVPAQGIFEESSTQKHPLGTRLQLGERVYYYAYATEALSPGKVATVVGKVFTDALADVAHPVGTKKVQITASGTVLAGELEEGFICVKSGTGAGEFYRIKRNPAITSGATGTIELYDGLVTAWSTSDTKLEIVTSLFKVQEHNTDAVEMPIGVANVAITTLNYFWLQTYGPCSVLMDGADGNSAVERELISSTNTAGAVMKYGTVGSAVVGSVFRDAVDNATAEYSIIFLRLVA